MNSADLVSPLHVCTLYEGDMHYEMKGALVYDENGGTRLTVILLFNH